MLHHSLDLRLQFVIFEHDEYIIFFLSSKIGANLSNKFGDFFECFVRNKNVRKRNNSRFTYSFEIIDRFQPGPQVPSLSTSKTSIFFTILDIGREEALGTRLESIKV